MFSGIKANIAHERASIAREIEYMRQNMLDSAISESMLIYEACDGGNGICSESDIISPEERIEIRKAINRIPDTDNSEEEIQRILSSEKPELSIDEVMGISTEDEMNPTEIAYESMRNELQSISNEDCENC